MFKEVRQFYLKESKPTLFVYLALRFLVIVCLILELIHGNWDHVFLCILTLVLYLIPYLVDKKLNIDLPNVMDILIFLFIFAAEILGEIQNFYGIIPYWDTILHTINGFLCAAIGFSLVDILNQSKKIHIRLSPIFVAIVAFCFSMTVGVLWEFFEFGADRFFNFDMQKDEVIQNISSVSLNPEGKNIPIILNNIDKTIIYHYNSEGELLETTISNGYLDIGIRDTMKDLLVNFIGAVVFSVFGFLHIKNRERHRFVKNFIPQIKK